MHEGSRFKLTYDLGWEIRETTRTGVDLDLREHGTWLGGLSVFLSRFSSVSEAVRSIKSDPTTEILSEGQVTIGNIQCYQLAVKEMFRGTLFMNKIISLPRESEVFLMMLGTVPQLYDRFLPFSNEVMYSFRFIEKVTVSVEPRVTSVIIDGTAHLLRDLPRTIWLEYGRTYSFTVEPVIPSSEGIRYVLDAWSDGNRDASRRITVTRSGELTAQYKTQYELKVQSELGNPQGAAWYDEGMTAKFSVTSPIPESGIIGILGAKTIFDHWSGDSTSSNPNESIVMNRQKTVIAVWKKDYAQAYLTVAAVVAAITIAAVVAIRKRSGPIRPSSPRPPLAECAPEKKCATCDATIAFDSEYCDECGAKQTMGS